MRETIKDIQNKLRARLYRNEEHVRLSLVARILQSLGWDIWNPKETNCEFIVAPTEDTTRVDVALFDISRNPSVFIEVKAVGKIQDNLEKTERQLRDYNRNLTALFCIITDGNIWRFYYPQTGGEFADKCFRIINLLEDEIDDIELNFDAFLSKDEIVNGQAKHEAESYLRLSQKQKHMKRALSKARQRIDVAPYPSLPEALILEMIEYGYKIKIEEAIKFINENHRKDDLEAIPVSAPRSTNSHVIPNPAPNTQRYNLSIPKNNVDASGEIVENGFLVHAGSKFSPVEQSSISKGNNKLRKTLTSKVQLIDKKSYFELVKDYLFKSPAQAAGVIAGCSINAQENWKYEGKTLNQLKSKI